VIKKRNEGARCLPRIAGTLTRDTALSARMVHGGHTKKEVDPRTAMPPSATAKHRELKSNYL